MLFLPAQNSSRGLTEASGSFVAVRREWLLRPAASHKFILHEPEFVHATAISSLFPQTAPLPSSCITPARHNENRLVQAELKAVNDKVEALEAQCAETVGEKKRLADEAETTANRLVRAEKLTSGLASEGVRWLESLENLGKQKVREARHALGWMPTRVPGYGYRCLYCCIVSKSQAFQQPPAPLSRVAAP